MAQEFAKDFYNSQEWKSCRAGFIKYKRGLCERCLASGIYRAGSTVHHKTPLTPENISNPDIALGYDNLMLLCRDCHAFIHRPDKRYKVDDLGRVITLG